MKILTQAQKAELYDIAYNSWWKVVVDAILGRSRQAEAAKAAYWELDKVASLKEELCVAQAALRDAQESLDKRKAQWVNSLKDRERSARENAERYKAALRLEDSCA